MKEFSLLYGLLFFFRSWSTRGCWNITLSLVFFLLPWFQISTTAPKTRISVTTSLLPFSLVPIPNEITWASLLFCAFGGIVTNYYISLAFSPCWKKLHTLYVNLAGSTSFWWLLQFLTTPLIDIFTIRTTIIELADSCRNDLLKGNEGGRKNSLSPVEAEPTSALRVRCTNKLCYGGGCSAVHILGYLCI